MFRVENNVPDVYKYESRDFQLISRLYDLVFQASRFSIDSMEQISDTLRCHDSLLPLIATKVGFFTNINLTNAAHRKVLCAFPYIINYKGSMKGLELTVNLLGYLMNTKVTIEQSKTDKSKLTLSFEKYAPNFELLKDIIDYIRPTGCMIDYKIISNIDIPDTRVGLTMQKSITKFNSYDDADDSGVIIKTTTLENHYKSNVGFTTIVNNDQISETEGGNHE